LKFKNLNLGCGELPQSSCLNVDKRRTSIVDVIADLDLKGFYFPFKDEQFEAVYIIDVIEHLDDVIKVMEEIHRVLKPGGRVFIRTTYWRTENSFTDPTHKHYFTEKSFDFFDPSTMFGSKYDYYTKKKFKVLEHGIDGQELLFKLRKA